jgi:hypothetical protein
MPTYGLLMASHIVFNFLLACLALRAAGLSSRLSHAEPDAVHLSHAHAHRDRGHGVLLP